MKSPRPVPTSYPPPRPSLPLSAVSALHNTPRSLHISHSAPDLDPVQLITRKSMHNYRWNEIGKDQLNIDQVPVSRYIFLN